MTVDPTKNTVLNAHAQIAAYVQLVPTCLPMKITVYSVLLVIRRNNYCIVDIVKTSNKESLKALYFRTCLYTNRAGKRFVNTTFSVLVHPNGVQSNPLFKIITIKKIDQKGLKKKITNSYPFLITLSKKATLV